MSKAFRPGLFLRGMAMGAAEAVPGVSGGTIAFVTGIYDEFIGTLAGLDLRALPMLAQRGLVHTWHQLNLTFLLTLGLGMVIAVVLFARFIEAALFYAAPVVWAFFLGLILYSVVNIAQSVPRQRLLTLGLLGLFLGLAITRLAPGSAPESLLWFFFGGAVAIGAWLLPAVSGSFLLLVLGLYEPVINALNQFDLTRIGVFALGCGAGLLMFSKLLRHAMTHYRPALLALLTGFMVGSLPKLWPWQIDGQLLLPGAYSLYSGEPAFLLWVVPSALLGAILLWGLGRLGP